MLAGLTKKRVVYILMPEQIIKQNKTLIVAADRLADGVRYVVEQVRDIDGVSAIKLGHPLIAQLTLAGAVDLVKLTSHEKLKTIYDGQKLGRDVVPAKNMSVVAQRASVDALIIYPKDEDTTKRWVGENHNREVPTIIGPQMTDEIVQSEGGNLPDSLCGDIVYEAAKLGIREFAVPANQPGRVKFYRRYLEHEFKGEEFSFYGIGIGRQRGKISEFAAVAPARRHAVVGSFILDAVNIQEAARHYAQEITSL